MGKYVCQEKTASMASICLSRVEDGPHLSIYLLAIKGSRSMIAKVLI